MAKNLTEIKAELSSGVSAIAVVSDLIDYLQAGAPAPSGDLAACLKANAERQTSNCQRRDCGRVKGVEPNIAKGPMNKEAFGILLLLLLLSDAVAGFVLGVIFWAKRNGKQTRLTTYLALVFFGIGLHGFLRMLAEGFGYIDKPRYTIGFGICFWLSQVSLVVPCWLLALKAITARVKPVLAEESKGTNQASIRINEHGARGMLHEYQEGHGRCNGRLLR